MTDLDAINLKLDKIISLLEVRRRATVAYNQPPPSLRDAVITWHEHAAAGFYSTAEIAEACDIPLSVANSIAIGRVMDEKGATRWRTSESRGFRL